MKLNWIKNENKNENKNKKLIRKLKKKTKLWLLWISVQVQEEKVLFGVFIVSVDASCRELKNLYNNIIANVM